MACRLLAVPVFLLCLVLSGASAETVPEPDGYRMDDYRAAVPATVRGGRAIATQEAQALWQRNSAVFIDMLPRAEKPANLPAGTLWRDKPRMSIPGSIWLANTGYGALSPAMESDFRRSLEEISGGDKAKPLVFFCLADCWMSWNGARRAISLGYSQVLWYAEGTDGWSGAGLPLEKVEPFAKR
ncbi:MAG: PQQ-dependent catabolism-associated CXXCW motif protein [Parvibaculaceae bacterium]